MPSQTYYNLEEEKQRKIIIAATQEFTEYDYPEVSINRIIQKVGIPRGSFYMYFKDKEDLYCYLMDQNRQKLNKLIKETIIQNKGDIYKSFEHLYDKIITNINKNDYKFIFKNLAIFLNLKKEKPFDHQFKELFNYIKDDLNTNNLNLTNINEAFAFLMHNLFMGIGNSLRNNDVSLKEIYITRLNIICYGIYKDRKESL